MGCHVCMSVFLSPGLSVICASSKCERKRPGLGDTLECIVDLLWVSGSRQATYRPPHPGERSDQFFIRGKMSLPSNRQMTLFYPFSRDKIRAKILDLRGFYQRLTHLIGGQMK